MLAKKPKGATKKRKSSSVSGLLWMFVGAVLTLMIGVFLYLSPLFDFTPSPNATTSDPNRQVQPRVNTDTDNNDYDFYDILPSQEMATIPDENIGELSTNQTSNTDFEPDVVITQPENSSVNDETVNAGDADGTVAESNRDNSTVGSSEDDIVIVEENATYEGTPVATNNEDSGNNNANNSANNSAAPNRANNAGATASANIEKAKPATTYILQINSFGSADEADRRRAQVLMAGVDAKVVKNSGSNGAVIYQVISRSMNNRQSVATAQQRLQNNGIDSIIVEQRR